MPALLTGVFLLDFPIEILYAFLTSLIHAISNLAYGTTTHKFWSRGSTQWEYWNWQKECNMNIKH